jgi:heavy metal translocating P-type ATPase
MKCIIKHESKNRIRVHLAQKRMSIRNADVLLYYLEANEHVKKATVYERTCDAVIYYEEGRRGDILTYLSRFDFEKENVGLQVPENTGRALTRLYSEKFVSNIVFNLVKAYIFPAPLRIAHTIYMAGKYILKGIKSLLNFRIDVEVLDAASIGVSVIRGDYNTAGSIMLLLGIGSMLEEWTHKKSLSDLARSMSLNIDKVWVRTEQGDVLLPIDKVLENDKIVVRSGNLIPLDGKIISGEAMVNQASLTGESIPVLKNEGAYVYAGTVVEEGECVFVADKQNGQSRYDKIVSMIENSEKLKSNTEEKAASLADKLVPYTLAGSVLTYLLTRNVTKALSVLMVDFSCALKLAMPLTVLSAMREANKYNITVKGGKFLEKLAKADIIVFDKTGTLTHASPKVEKILVAKDRDEKEMLRLAACLEEHFPHSMAKAVVNKAYSLGLDHEEMHSEVEYVVAHGISSMVDGEKVIIGSAHFVFEDEKVSVANEDKFLIDDLDHKYSHLYMAIAGRLAAVICIFDPLREEAKDVLEKLKELGIEKTVMMTGDNENTAKAVASQLGIDEYYAAVLPEDKANFVEKKKAEGKIVVMVGDGINDSPALSASDCGIAISDGAAIAREISDITIAADNLNELVILKEIANGLAKRVDRNYRFVLGFNSALILGGVAGILQPTFSALLHNSSTVAISLASMTDIRKNKNTEII